VLTALQKTQGREQKGSSPVSSWQCFNKDLSGFVVKQRGWKTARMGRDSSQTKGERRLDLCGIPWSQQKQPLTSCGTCGKVGTQREGQGDSTGGGYEGGGALLHPTSWVWRQRGHRTQMAGDSEAIYVNDDRAVGVTLPTDMP
jgi:hypothetical protein